METKKTKILRDSISTNALLYAVERGYKVTRHGDVIGAKGRKLKLLIHRNGYLYFNVRVPKYGPYHVPVHRLAALQKYGARVFNTSLEVIHRDQNKQNNHFENIGLGTHKENSQQTPKHLLWNIDQRAPVACRRGNVINYFPSIYDAAKFTGVNSGSISLVCNGKRRTAGGLVWWFLPKIKPIGTYK